VPEYLSEMWLRELDRAVRDAVRVSALAPIVIEQVVSGVPGRGEVRYRLQVGDDGATVTEIDSPVGETADAGRSFDVRLTTDYPTAVAIARGQENAQIALARGRLRLGGNVDALVQRSDVLAALDDATAELRATTTYPAVSPSVPPSVSP
jgi:hypothetical protein